MNKIEEILSAGGVYVFDTQGDSMKPMLQQGETRISLVLLPPNYVPKRGDLPVYRRVSGQVVCHRVVKVCSPTVVKTRGDNRRGAEAVEVSSFLGIVDGYYRKGLFIPVTDKGYRRYVRWWLFSYPLRWIWLVARDIPRKLKGN